MTSTSTSTSNTTGQSGLGAKIKGAAQMVHGAGENIRGTILGGVDTVVHKGPSANDEIASKGRQQTAEGLANFKGRPMAAEYTNPTGATSAAGYGNNTAGTVGSGAPQNAGLQTAQTAPQSNAQQTYPATDSINQNSNLGGGQAPAQTYPNAQQDYGTSSGAPQGHGSANTTGSYANNKPYPDRSGVAQDIPNYDGPGNMQQPTRQDRPLGEPQHHRDDAISGDPDAVAVGQQQPVGSLPPGYTSGAGGPTANTTQY
ncbi:hypothetical protein B0H11DRAFT_60084 [Mycena galericulata]|nr:hypothetical protein B0H11DRAFT_60084 [Mycena galericulata]